MSKKVQDRNNRWRSKSVGFMMSPEEVEHLNNLVSLTGLSKQDYIISRLLCRDIVVQGNPRVYKALRNHLVEVLNELKRIDGLNEHTDNELLDLIKMITITLNGLNTENKNSPHQ